MGADRCIRWIPVYDPPYSRESQDDFQRPWIQKESITRIRIIWIFLVINFYFLEIIRVHKFTIIANSQSTDAAGGSWRGQCSVTCVSQTL
jgi:hypothetical protein